MSLISYFGKGEKRERYLGVKIPPTNLKPDYLEQAQRVRDRAGGWRPRRSVRPVQRSRRAAERATHRHDEGEHT